MPNLKALIEDLQTYLERYGDMTAYIEDPLDEESLIRVNGTLVCKTEDAKQALVITSRDITDEN